MSFVNIFQNYDEQSFKNALNDAISKFTSELTNTLNIEKEVINKIWLNSMSNKPQTQISTCKYVCSRGKNKGQVCLSKANENGFCKKHQKQEKNEVEKENKDVNEVENEKENKDGNEVENENEVADTGDNTCKFCFKKGKNIGKRCTKKVSKKSLLGYCSTHIKEEKN
jgi:hypothetical protein